MKKIISLLLALTLTALCSCTDAATFEPLFDDEDAGEEYEETMADESDKEESVPTPASPKPELTVSVKYTHIDPGEANATARYGTPTLELSQNVSAADVLNNSEALASIVSGAREGAENIISYALETPELAEQYAFFYDSGITYVNASESHICYAFADSAYAGGAHPNSAEGYYNFSLETGELLTVSDILSSDNENAKAELEAAIVAAFEADNTWTFSSYESIAAEFTAGDAGNIWRLESDALVLLYSPYMIASYASGYIEVTVDYDDIPGVIDQKYIPESRTAEGTANFDIYGADEDKALAAAHRYGEKTSAVLIADGEVFDVTVRALSRGNDVIFYASSFEDCALYLEEGDTYTVTYNGGESVEFIV